MREENWNSSSFHKKHKMEFMGFTWNMSNAFMCGTEIGYKTIKVHLNQHERPTKTQSHTLRRLTMQCHEFFHFHFVRWAHDLWWTSIDSDDKNLSWLICFHIAQSRYQHRAHTIRISNLNITIFIFLTLQNK